MTLSVRLTHSGPLLNVEADMPEGAIVAILGPSGSGKTSVLRAIAGLLTPGSGQIALDADVWFDSACGINLPAWRRPIGWVPQNYALFPHLTAQGNVECALLDRPRSARVASAKNVLAQLHVSGLENRFPHQLSGGQQQRVACARALARSPRLLLLDEPFSAVDRATRRQLHTELKRLHQNIESTIVLVTHDLEEARLLADHMIVLDCGRVLQAGAPWEVEHAPMSIAAARLLGIQNIFEAVFAPVEGAPSLRWGEYRLTCRPPARRLDSGQPVSWCISAGQIVLHRTDRPSRWGSDNPIDCIIEEILVLGDEAQVSLRPQALGEARLLMKLSQHLVQRNRLAAGGAARVSLLSSALQPLTE